MRRADLHPGTRGEGRIQCQCGTAEISFLAGSSGSPIYCCRPLRVGVLLKAVDTGIPIDSNMGINPVPLMSVSYFFRVSRRRYSRIAMRINWAVFTPRDFAST